MNKWKSVNFKEKKRIHLVFFAVCAVLLLNFIYWGSRKEGYYVDELWSYGLANSYYTPFLQDQDDYMEHWHDAAFYKSYLTVSSREEAFSYASVYNNQVHDVHPPLYYILLHTICSLFQGKFSKWFGLAVNFLFFAGVIVLLYKIAGFIMGEENYARLIPSIIYGISGGGISTAMYIRMYLMSVFWGLLFIYLTFQLLKDDREMPGLAGWGGVIVVSMAGFLTHYYFLIFAFFVSGGYVLFRLFHRQWKKALSYSGGVTAGIGLGILVFPASLSHIFTGAREESLVNAIYNGKTFFTRFMQYMEIAAKSFFLNKNVLATIVIAVILLGCITYLTEIRKKRLNNKDKLNDETIRIAGFWILTITLSGYFLVIVQISTGIVERYQLMVYPAGVLMIVSIIHYFLRQIKKAKGIWLLTAVYILCCIWNYNFNVENINYIYPGYKAAIQALNTEYRYVPGIYVTSGNYFVVHNSLFLSQQESTYPIQADNLGKLPEICTERECGQLILYVDSYLDTESVVAQASELMGYSFSFLVYDSPLTRIFCLSR